MKRIDKYKISEVFQGEESEILRITYTNRTNGGFHEGVDLHFYESEYVSEVSVFLDDMESIRLRDLLLKLYPISGE